MEKIPKTNTGKVSDVPDKKELKKFTATIVDTTDLMRKQAEDVGNEKMTIEAESEDLAKAGRWEKFGKKEFWTRLGQKTWKFGVARDYYRNKEIYKASEEILKEQNVYVGEGRDKDAHNKVMNDILDQFTSGYDDAIHTEAGEKKVELKSEDKEQQANKEAVKQLIKDYATGKIDKVNFQEEEKRLFNDLKGKIDEEKVKGNTMYTSNLFNVAEQIKLAIQNGKFLENEDFEIDVIYGRSKASVRTEAHYTNTERIIKKMLHTEVGQFVNETSLSIALSCVASLAARSAATLPGKVLPIIGTAAISSWFANVRAKTEEEEKRKLHFRQIAKGETYNQNDRTPNRTEMDAFRYKTEPATNILNGIEANLKNLETNGSNLTEQELTAIFTEISALEAKVRLSDRKNIDLITYSDTTKVVEERKNIDIKKRQIKDALQKAYADKKIQFPNEQDFEAYYNSLSTTEENRLLSEADTGIDAKDRMFNKAKDAVGKKAAWIAFRNGILIGTTMQEVTSLFTGRVGIGEDILHQIKGQDTLAPGMGTENLTALAYLKHLVQGDIPKMGMGNIHEVLVGQNHIKLPQGVDMLKNPDGTYNLINGNRILGEHLVMNTDGSLSESAKSILAHSGVGIENHLTEGVVEKTVSPEDYIKNHSELMKEIHRMGWFDNDTKDFDLNELKTHLGGINGKGIDADGNYVINVGKMMPDDSFHEALSADAQKLMQAGSLKMLFSLSKETQGHAFEFNISPKGEIIIPPGSEAGKVLFENIQGKLQFNGRFGEIAQDMGNGKYMILSTMEGKGLGGIIDKVQIPTQETILDVPGVYAGEMPPFVTIVPGNPLEKIINDKKGIAFNEEKEPKDKNEKPVMINNTEEKAEKQETLNEISQEEYDGVRDDLKMINRKIQISEGIITLSKDDFKSEYGKKRYTELNSIPDGIPVRFNKTELQTIGDELEKILKNSRVVDQQVIDGLKFFREKGQLSVGAFQNKFNLNLEEAEKLIEKVEIAYDKEMEEKEQISKKDKSKTEVKEVKAETNSAEVKEKEIPQKTPESKPSTNEEKKQYTLKDLSKIGTAIETKDGYQFTTTKFKKPWFGSNKVEGILKDKNGKEYLVSYKTKELEKEFIKGNIKIIKIEEEK